MTNKDELAALRKRVEELEAKAKPPEKSDFVPMTPEQWRDEMHALAERRMSMATPPEVVRDLSVLDDALCAGIRGDARAPTGRPGMIPNQQPSGGGGPSAGDGTGWAREIPIGPSMHQRYVDMQLDHQDKLDRAELARKLGKG